MRKNILLAMGMTAALMLTACSKQRTDHSSANEQAAEASAAIHSSEGARECVTEMYEQYFRQASDTATVDEEVTPMSRYLTQDLSALLDSCIARQNATGDLYLDYDFWINAQDCGQLELKETKVTKYADSTAVVTVDFTNFGQPAVATVEVRYDAAQDTWLVDDFINGEGGSLKNSLEQCMK